jgi:hypothetical protein
MPQGLTVTCEAYNAFRAAGRRLPDSMLEEIAAHLCRLERWASACEFTHAVPMHAIQVLAVLAWLLSRSGLPHRHQLQLVALAVVGYAGLFGVALLRTTSGLAPFDLRNASILGYLMAAAFLAAPAVAAVTAHHRRVPSPKD